MGQERGTTQNPVIESHSTKLMIKTADRTDAMGSNLRKTSGEK
jgi:hypothetical protein